MSKSYIEQKPYATTFSGEPATRVFQMRTIIGALELEQKGIKFRFSALKKAKQLTGLKTNDRNKHIAALREKVEEMLKEVEIR